MYVPRIGMVALEEEDRFRVITVAVGLPAALATASEKELLIAVTIHAYDCYTK